MSRFAGGSGPRVVTLSNPSAGVAVGQAATGHVTIQGGQTVFKTQAGNTITTDEAASSFVSRILYPDLTLVTGGDGGSSAGTTTLQSSQPQQVI